MGMINRFWYSEEQKRLSEQIRGRHVCKVKVDGEWREYTEWTTSPNGKCNWKDAVLVAESLVNLPLMVNGVLQGSW